MSAKVYVIGAVVTLLIGWAWVALDPPDDAEAGYMGAVLFAALWPAVVPLTVGLLTLVGAAFGYTALVRKVAAKIRPTPDAYLVAARQEVEKIAHEVQP